MTRRSRANLAFSLVQATVAAAGRQSAILGSVSSRDLLPPSRYAMHPKTGLPPAGDAAPLALRVGGRLKYEGMLLLENSFCLPHQTGVG